MQKFNPTFLFQFIWGRKTKKEEFIIKAIILAAGIGSRLKPLTDEIPKTLVQINGKPIIASILEAIYKTGIKDIIICVGYKAEKVINYCKENYNELNIIFVENREYLTTNNMYSLYLAKHFFNDDILLMNADVIFEPNILKELIEKKGSVVAVDKNIYLEESMKIIVSEYNNQIIRISKKISTEDAYGCSIDIYKIVREDLVIIEREMRLIIEKNKEHNQWTEIMLDNLFKKRELKMIPFEINQQKWVEIDNFKDLKQAELLFGCVER